MRRITLAFIAFLSFSTIMTVRMAHALNVETHSLVNAAASWGNDELFHLFLQKDLGLLRGLLEPFEGKTVYAWINEGGIREDDSDLLSPRFFRHFHDPLKSWDVSGFGFFESSVRWMQRTNQGWAWPDARRSYYAALTTIEPLTRAHNWANTFRALGQAMHLVVDASVPEHVRNDAHPLESFCRMDNLKCYGNYEYWVSDAQAEDVAAFWAAYLSNPIGFDAAILRQPTGDLKAPVPIARLIDTNTYTGLDPNVTLSLAIGIGEFANANFFSEDTAGQTYPFPSVARLAPSRLPSKVTGQVRAYLKKGPGDGVPVDPVRAICAYYRRGLSEGVLQPILYSCADENVWEATARIMLPRAVGYARGVLDYFFRGRIEIAPPSRFVYALAPFQGETGSFTKLRFKVRNATPGESAGSGMMIATVQYRLPLGNASLIDNPFAPITEEVFSAVSDPVAVTLTEDFQEFVFDFSRRPIPTNSADLFLKVVYKGRLGYEDDAVIVGGKNLFEPDPLDSTNLTDYDCYLGQPKYVVGLPAFNPPVHAERDLNGDRIQDLYGPWIQGNQLIKTFDLNGPLFAPSATNFDFSIPEESYAQYGRFILLQDQPTYGVAFLDDFLQEVPSGATFTNLGGSVGMDAVFNEVAVDEAGRTVRRILPSVSFRGISHFHGLVLANTNMPPCFPQVPSLPEPLTRVNGSLPLD